MELLGEWEEYPGQREYTHSRTHTHTHRADSVQQKLTQHCEGIILNFFLMEILNVKVLLKSVDPYHVKDDYPPQGTLLTEDPLGLQIVLAECCLAG